MTSKFLLAFLFALSTFSDIPPQPRDLVEVCRYSKEGMPCQTYLFSGKCTTIDKVATCVKNAIKEENSFDDSKESSKSVETHLKTQDTLNGVTAGCSNIHNINAVSFLVIIMAYLLLCHRKKAH